MACGALIAELLMLGSNPESKPPAKWTQGISYEDWVAEWFPDSKRKIIVSPTLAITDSGVKIGSVSAKTYMVSMNFFPPFCKAAYRICSSGSRTRRCWGDWRWRCRASCCCCTQTRNFSYTVREAINWECVSLGICGWSRVGDGGGGTSRTVCSNDNRSCFIDWRVTCTTISWSVGKYADRRIREWVSTVCY